jgi:hypothetical protein
MSTPSKIPMAPCVRISFYGLEHPGREIHHLSKYAPGFFSHSHGEGRFDLRGVRDSFDAPAT